MERADPAKLKDIDRELQALIVFCREQGLVDKEIRHIFTPIWKGRSKNTWKVIGVLVVVVLSVYILAKLDFFAWHLSALGRIVMIKMLNWYDWRPLKSSRGCLLGGQVNRFKPIEQCYYCEGIKYIPFTESIDAEFLNENFLELERPVIIPYNYTNVSNLESIFTDVINDIPYSDTIPCKLATNIPRLRGHSVYEILGKIERHDSFFAHFQNCDFDAVKKFRKIVPRPYFYIPDVSPVQYSWILTSRDYDVENWKDVALSDRIAAVIQVLGSNTYQIKPIHGCKHECQLMQIELFPGEVLLITSRWDLSYRPAPTGENFAVILESH